MLLDFLAPRLDDVLLRDDEDVGHGAAAEPVQGDPEPDLRLAEPLFVQDPRVLQVLKGLHSLLLVAVTVRPVHESVLDQRSRLHDASVPASRVHHFSPSYM